MLRTVQKFPLFQLERVWFEEKVCSLSSKADVIRYLRLSCCDENERNKYLCDENLTLVSDLTMTEEELLKLTRKQVRYEIKKCMNEDVTILTYSSKKILEDSNIIKDFEHVYDNFCIVSGQKNMRKVFSKKNNIEYAKSDCLLITKAEYEHGSVYHVYIYNDHTALLTFSASDFRNSNVDRNLAARANKLLHYKDMLYFKELGCTNYDWGNITSLEEPNGIDTFKISFGGEPKKVYNAFVANSWLGSILVKVKKKVSRK